MGDEPACSTIPLVVDAFQYGLVEVVLSAGTKVASSKLGRASGSESRYFHRVSRGISMAGGSNARGPSSPPKALRVTRTGRPFHETFSTRRGAKTHSMTALLRSPRIARVSWLA